MMIMSNSGYGCFFSRVQDAVVHYDKKIKVVMPKYQGIKYGPVKQKVNCPR